ncbi:ribonuclease 2-like [Bidens hawaiensis]|uniref:ribonuclease 2-like n=1 Tax=Bidens hawaiensis TaxID=980011 RepID=UPI00404B3A03
MLSLQWPATFCSTHSTKCCPQNGCCPGANSPPGFTIHGLWPSNEDGTWLSCCTNNAFDEKEISSLVGALSIYWPILSCNNISSCHGKKNRYWAHQKLTRLDPFVVSYSIGPGRAVFGYQWEKYGTCAAPVTRDEYEYFLTTLEVYLKNNVTDVLLEAGYVPSDLVKYPSSDIMAGQVVKVFALLK